MIPEAAKIGIAMDLIENKIGNCMNKRRKDKNQETDKEYKELLLDREEIYKGNYEVINKIIKEAGEEQKND